MKRRFLAVFAAIAVICFVFNHFFGETTLLGQAPKIVRYFLFFATIFVVMLLGCYAFLDCASPAIAACWLLLYLAGISFLTIEGLINILAYPIPIFLKLLSARLIDLLLSPLLIFVFYIFAVVERKRTANDGR